MKASRLTDIISDAIELLASIDLKVKVLVLDQESTQQMVLKKDFKVTSDEPWLHRGNDDDPSNRVYVVWDVPHLLKNTRGQIMKYFLQVTCFYSLHVF